MECCTPGGASPTGMPARADSAPPFRPLTPPPPGCRRLGLGKPSSFALGSHRSPVRVPKLSAQRVVQVSCGLNFAAACTNKGDVYSWGYNSSGKLGLGDAATRFHPTQVAFPGRAVCIAQVSCGAPLRPLGGRRASARRSLTCLIVPHGHRVEPQCRHKHLRPPLHLGQGPARPPRPRHAERSPEPAARGGQPRGPDRRGRVLRRLPHGGRHCPRAGLHLWARG